MTEDVILKLLGWAGVVGLIAMGVKGIYNRYKEMYRRPVEIIYYPAVKKKDKSEQ